MTHSCNLHGLSASLLWQWTLQRTSWTQEADATGMYGSSGNHGCMAERMDMRAGGCGCAPSGPCDANSKGQDGCTGCALPTGAKRCLCERQCPWLQTWMSLRVARCSMADRHTGAHWKCNNMPTHGSMRTHKFSGAVTPCSLAEFNASPLLSHKCETGVWCSRRVPPLHR